MPLLVCDAASSTSDENEYDDTDPPEWRALPPALPCVRSSRLAVTAMPMPLSRSVLLPASTSVSVPAATLAPAPAPEVESQLSPAAASIDGSDCASSAAVIG